MTAFGAIAALLLQLLLPAPQEAAKPGYKIICTLVGGGPLGFTLVCEEVKITRGGTRGAKPIGGK